jgi:hypothetical protein
MADDLSSLVWAANLADLELHTSLARANHTGWPTAMVFNLDPGPPATLLHCARVALQLRERLDGMSLQSFPKTTGSKDLQIFVPLNTPVTYDVTKNLARTLAQQDSETLLLLQIASILVSRDCMLPKKMGSNEWPLSHPLQRPFWYVNCYFCDSAGFTRLTKKSNRKNKL